MIKASFIVTLLVIAAVTAAGAGGCGDKENAADFEAVLEDMDQDLNNSTSFNEKRIELPELAEGQKTFTETLSQRASRRNFSSEGLTLEEVGNLLWAAGGSHPDGMSGATRTAPSAGGAYPLEIYLVAGAGTEGLEAGVYRYAYQDHALTAVAEGDRRELLAASALDQTFIAEAPVNIVLVAYYGRTTQRYGDRGVRYVHMDAGYASQNIYLMAEELNLGTVAVGAFDDSSTADVLETDGAPLKIMPVGHEK